MIKNRVLICTSIIADLHKYQCWGQGNSTVQPNQSCLRGQCVVCIASAETSRLHSAFHPHYHAPVSIDCCVCFRPRQHLASFVWDLTLLETDNPSKVPRWNYQPLPRIQFALQVSMLTKQGWVKLFHLLRYLQCSKMF